MKKQSPLNVALSASVLIGSIGLAAQTQADTNPFSINPLESGYEQLNKGEEGKCGEGKCGEGKCGGDKADKEGKCGEGKCGEGKCGAK